MTNSLALDDPSATATKLPTIWYLEGFSDCERESSVRIALGHFPFYVGRSPGLSLTLSSSQVSKRHATIDKRESELWLHDLGSKNGTGVNGKRITDPVRLQNGDRIQFAQLQFHVACEGAELPLAVPTGSTAELQTVESLLSQILQSGDVVPHYQPIVRLSNGTRLGYEVLARTSNSGSQPASVLFYAAKRLGVEAQVSDLCRREGLAQGRTLPGRPTLFVNTHATELAHVPFLESLRNFREQARVTPIVLEIQEAQVCDPGTIRDLVLVARAYGLKLAFHNFGGNEIRLRQLLDFQPDYIKFDYSLIHAVHQAPLHRQRFLTDLVQQARAGGAGVIAGGVESREEFFHCQRLGFDFAQGLYVGRPLGRADLLASNLKSKLTRPNSARASLEACGFLVRESKRSSELPEDGRAAKREPVGNRVRTGARRNQSDAPNLRAGLKAAGNLNGRGDSLVRNRRNAASAGTSRNELNPVAGSVVRIPGR